MTEKNNHLISIHSLRRFKKRYNLFPLVLPNDKQIIYVQIYASSIFCYENLKKFNKKKLLRLMLYGNIYFEKKKVVYKPFKEFNINIHLLRHLRAFKQHIYFNKKLYRILRKSAEDYPESIVENLKQERKYIFISEDWDYFKSNEFEYISRINV